MELELKDGSLCTSIRQIFLWCIEVQDQIDYMSIRDIAVQSRNDVMCIKFENVNTFTVLDDCILIGYEREFCVYRLDNIVNVWVGLKNPVEGNKA